MINNIINLVMICTMLGATIALGCTMEPSKNTTVLTRYQLLSGTN